MKTFKMNTFKMVAIVAIVAVVIYYIYKFMSEKKPIAAAANSGKIKDTLADIAKIDPKNAPYVEKIARLESNHFKDSKANESNNFGFMLAFNNSFPFGWNELTNDWNANGHKPNGVYTAKNGFNYLKFDNAADSLYSILYKLQNLEKQGLSPGYYNSKNPLIASDYLAKLNSIKNQYTN